jgi:hypothetical protein
MFLPGRLRRILQGPWLFAEGGLSETQFFGKLRSKRTFESTFEQALVVLVPPVYGNVSGILHDEPCHGVGKEGILDLAKTLMLANPPRPLELCGTHPVMEGNPMRYGVAQDRRLKGTAKISISSQPCARHILTSIAILE